MLLEVCDRPEVSVGVNWQDHDTAMFVVGHEYPATGRIAGQVTRLTTKARLMTQRRQLACLTIHFERRYRARVEAQAFAYGEQKAARRIEGQKRRVHFGDGLRDRKLPADRVPLEDVNAL